MLTYVIYSITHVTNGEIIKYPTRKADQRRHRSDQRTWHRCQGSSRNGRSLPNLKTLSPKLIQITRNYAKASGYTISDIVTRALETYLYKGRKRGY